MSPRQRRKQTFLASIMLGAFASRALIPPGFMPAGDRPLSLEICWEGFPAAMLAHGESAHPGSGDMGSMDMGSMSPAAMSAGAMATSHGERLHGAHVHHHPGSPAHSEHCIFGASCSAGPTPHLPPPSDVPPAQPVRSAAFASFAGAVRLVHLPQPRAPPDRLS